MADDLDNTIKAEVAAEAANKVNIGFVDPRATFDGTGGHWACGAGGTPYINALVASSNTGSSPEPEGDVPGTGSFHPTAAGQAAYAQLVNSYLAG